MDVLAERLDRLVELVHCLVQNRGDRLLRHPIGQPLDAQSDGEEILDDYVMQVACDSIAVFDNCDRLETLAKPGGTHRRPPDDGECLDQRNVGLVETPRLVRQIEVPENGVPGPAGVPPRNDSIGGCPSGNPYESA